MHYFSSAAEIAQFFPMISAELASALLGERPDLINFLRCRTATRSGKLYIAPDSGGNSIAVYDEGLISRWTSSICIVNAGACERTIRGLLVNPQRLQDFDSKDHSALPEVLHPLFSQEWLRSVANLRERYMFASPVDNESARIPATRDSPRFEDRLRILKGSDRGYYLRAELPMDALNILRIACNVVGISISLSVSPSGFRPPPGALISTSDGVVPVSIARDYLRVLSPKDSREATAEELDMMNREIAKWYPGAEAVFARHCDFVTTTCSGHDPNHLSVGGNAYGRAVEGADGAIQRMLESAIPANLPGAESPPEGFNNFGYIGSAFIVDIKLGGVSCWDAGLFPLVITEPMWRESLVYKVCKDHFPTGYAEPWAEVMFAGSNRCERFDSLNSILGVDMSVPHLRRVSLGAWVTTALTHFMASRCGYKAPEGVTLADHSMHRRTLRAAVAALSRAGHTVTNEVIPSGDRTYREQTLNTLGD